MRTVLEQTSNKRMQGIVQEVIADIEGGKQLSDAFSNILKCLISYSSP